MRKSDDILRGLQICTEWGLTRQECSARGCPYVLDDGDREGLFCLQRLHRDAMGLIRPWKRTSKALPEKDTASLLGWMAWGGVTVVAYRRGRFISPNGSALPPDTVLYWMEMPDGPGEGSADD